MANDLLELLEVVQAVLKRLLLPPEGVDPFGALHYQLLHVSVFAPYRPDFGNAEVGQVANLRQVAYEVYEHFELVLHLLVDVELYFV